MYRPLTHVDACGTLLALGHTQLLAVPGADEAIDEHLRKPHARATRAAAIPAVTAVDAASAPIEAFYHAIVYPVWHYPEASIGLPRVSIGERLRRLYPWHRWPYDTCGADDGPPLRVLVAGAGSGHQVAQHALTLTGCEFVALDLSAASLAYGEQQLSALLPDDATRVTSVVGDLMCLGSVQSSDDAASACHARHIAPKFHFVCCFGVLHHTTNPVAALSQLASAALLPGGVLQVATYSALSVCTWRPHARRLLHRMAPQVIDARGDLRRQPTPHELRHIRALVLELSRAGADGAAATESPTAREVRERLGAMAGAEGEAARDVATARMLTMFEELYCSGGFLDLLFHPQEAMFTLHELHSMLDMAGLESLGVAFLSAAADRRGRDAFRSAEGGAWCARDPCMCDLRLWHQLEVAHPHLFGRMHVVYCRLKSTQPRHSASTEAPIERGADTDESLHLDEAVQHSPVQHAQAGGAADASAPAAESMPPLPSDAAFAHSLCPPTPAPPVWAIRIDEVVGRHLVATQRLPAGATIFCETPAAVAEAAAPAGDAWGGDARTSSAALSSFCALAIELMRLPASSPVRLLQRPSLAAELQLGRSLELQAKAVLSELTESDRTLADALPYGQCTADVVRWALGVAIVNAHWASAPDRAVLGVLASMMQHSCEPCCRVVIGSAVAEGSAITLRTTREVHAGEPLTISYVPTRGTVTERRSALLNQHGFACCCQRCEAELEAEPWTSVKPS